MLARVVLAAILAGIAASLVMSAVQTWRVTPLILAAEQFETADHPHAGQKTAAGDQHDAEAWAPADGMERIGFTLLANGVAGVAFALLLSAVAVLTGLPLTVSNGALWGLAGFAVFSLAPAAGLPPELPGMPAGDLIARQVWWFATVVATAGGILLLVLSKSIAIKPLALAVMALPHVIGAPQVETSHSDVPAVLATSFAANSLATAAIFWIVLGVLLGWTMTRGQLQAKDA